jgi:hypothetical protein
LRDTKKNSGFAGGGEIQAGGPRKMHVGAR